MANTPDSDIFPTITYIDPLIMPAYIRTNNWDSIRAQIYGDWLLSAFVHKLNQEIVDDVEEWKEKKEIVAQIFDDVRTFGWCVFQSYTEFDKVFTPLQKEDWIKEPNEETGKLDRVGIKVKWTDDLGNTWSDSLYFDDRENENGTIVGKAYLLVWKFGDGQPLHQSPSDTAFAIPDCDLSVLSLAIQIRQIQNTLTFGATNPYFYHLKYGDAINPTQRKALITQIGYVNTSKGLGAKKNILEEIVAVENGSIEKCIAALDELLSFYAATTRLPLSFYFGEKQIGSGLDSGGAEDIDQQRVMAKKEYILQHFAESLTEIAAEAWGITLPDLYGFYEGMRQEQKAEQEKKMQQQAAITPEVEE